MAIESKEEFLNDISKISKPIDTDRIIIEDDISFLSITLLFL